VWNFLPDGAVAGRDFFAAFSGSVTRRRCSRSSRDANGDGVKNGLTSLLGAADRNVTFVVVAGPVGPPAVNTVTATINSAAAAGGAKLFGCLEATQP